MQRDARAFAVEHDRAETVRADRMGRFEHLTAEFFHMGEGIADAPVDIQVDQRAARAAALRRFGHEDVVHHDDPRLTAGLAANHYGFHRSARAASIEAVRQPDFTPQI